MRRKLAIFLVFLASFTLVYSSIAFYLLSTPPAEAFMGFGIFSDKGTLSQYFQGFGPTVIANQTFNWHFEVNNRMGSIQFAKIVFRLENQSMATPNETSPAPTGQIGEANAFVTNGENSSIGFDWTVLRTSRVGNLTFLTLQVNGQHISPLVGAPAGANFRFVFELWTLNSKSGLFQYGWQGPNVRVGSWLQVWFSASS